SSFAATCVSAPTLDPVYTASSVSKSDPRVENVTAEPDGAVHEYHTDAPARLPSTCVGSPLSSPAPTFDPLIEPLGPEIPVAFANRSFAGGDPAIADCATHAASKPKTSAARAPRRRKDPRFMPPPQVEKPLGASSAGLGV